MLRSKLSTEHFPSMDPATKVLRFYCKHNDRGSHLLKEDRSPALHCEGKTHHAMENGKIQEARSNSCQP